MERHADKIKLVLAMIVFGTIGLVRRAIPCSSGVIALVRGAVGALFLLSVKLIRRRKAEAGTLRRNLPVLAASGVLIGANWICLFEAYRFTTVSAATVCYYMAPVFVVLASPLVLHERLTLRRIICTAAALLGAALTSGVIETGFTGITGIILALAAAAMYAAVILLNKFIRHMSDSDRTLYQLAFAAAALVPYVLITEDIPSAISADGRTVLLLAVAGIIHTGIAYTMYFGSIKNVPASAAALISYIDPVTAVLLSVTVLHERLSVPAAIGAVTVIAAAIIGDTDGKQYSKKSEKYLPDSDLRE